MLKYLFVIYHNDYKKFLESLRSIGVVDVEEKKDIESEDIQNRQKELSELITIRDDLIQLKSETDNIEEVRIEDCADLYAKYSEYKSEIDAKENKLSALRKEYALSEPWGKFDEKKLRDIIDKGVDIFFYAMSVEDYENVEDSNIFKIFESANTVYFVTIKAPIINDNVERLDVPERSCNTVKKEIHEAERGIEELKYNLASLAVNLEVVDREIEDIQKIIEFKRVALSAENYAEDKIKIMEGWIPADKEQDLNRVIENFSVYYESDKPNVDDEIPVKLKNNKFNSLFEKIGDLYSLPDYKEMDLTPFFAPFYMLFFGFCLGDAGYGLLIVLAAIFAYPKVGNKTKPVLKLGILLGLSTVFMGILSGSFFGINLIKADWEWMEKYKSFMLDQDKLMILSLILGFIQIIMGMFIKAVNNIRMFGWQHAISNLGWIFLVIGGLGLYFANENQMIAEGKFNTYLYSLLGITALPIFFFNSPGKNVALNFGIGIWDAYNMASGLLGDLLSYIRLFALGISSAVLGSVFNQLALELNGNIPVVSQLITLFILLFGHSLNLFIAGLGSFVHPLRLTFVEFYKNAGFIGGGRKYEPFN